MSLRILIWNKAITMPISRADTQVHSRDKTTSREIEYSEVNKSCHLGGQVNLG